MGSRFVVPTVAACVDLVVHLALAPDGRREVEEVVAVPGRAESDVFAPGRHRPQSQGHRRPSATISKPPWPLGRWRAFGPECATSESTSRQVRHG
jgi:hypothetical protein